MTKPHAASWNDFWAANAAQGATDGGGCLPDGYKGIDAAQRDVWRGFARSLPKNARMLDLATGDGRVMEWILRARRDIKPTGCDLAPELPTPPKGTRVKTGVPMESLPFPNGRFGVVTSQFGFEYGEVEKVAAEAARVLRPGGTLGLLMHRGDGPILAHNLKRRTQIVWVLEESGLIEIAKRSLKARALGLSAIPEEVAQAPAEGAAKFGAGSAGWEIAEAIKQTLTLSARDHPANVARVLDNIAAKARNELGRIASLEQACATADNHTALDAAFRDANLEAIEQRDVSELSGTEGGANRPFATFRRFRRTA